MPSVAHSAIEIDFERYYSLESKQRKRSQLKELRPYFEIPGMISFGVGIPHPSTFPVSGMTLSIPFANKSVLIPGVGVRTSKDLLPLEEYTPLSKGEALNPDLTEELQYSSTYGTPHLLKWLKEHVQRVHAPKYDEWNILCTAGNTDGTDAVMRACLDRGDHLLVEEFAYPGLLSPAISLGFKPIGVPMDKEGVNAQALDRLMEEWDEQERGGPRPKLIVVVPTCSNPAGVTIPEHRKREIYGICRKWALLIVEDDPYCFLQMRPKGAESPIVPTFLSLDTDGRVVRIDSYSKIVAPGSRLGFITAHKTLLEKIMNTRESATQCPSGISIATITAVLRAWGGHEGFENRYIPQLSEIYSKRALLLVDLLKRHAPLSTIEIPAPSGGMFLWVRLRIDSHPDYPTKTPQQISQQVFESMIAEKVLACPGHYFKAPSVKEARPEEDRDNIFIRMSYSLPSSEEMEEGVIRFSRALSKEWQL